jgi:hypothetical protein
MGKIAKQEPKTAVARNSKNTETETAFSFGARRLVSSGPRRLFVPQKVHTAPVFQPVTERPHAILRVVSRCG